GLAVDSDNAQIQKQMRQVKAKRSAHRRAEGGSGGAVSAPAVAVPGGAGYPGLDSAISKDVMDLQEQLMSTTKEYRIAKANVARAQHGRRSGKLTKAELERLPPRDGREDVPRRGEDVHAVESIGRRAASG
ncbi:hypothetical protein ACHAWF_000486, partial [Thalassiosira exigua]